MRLLMLRRGANPGHNTLVFSFPIVLMALLIFACRGIVEPDLEFEQMEIHYTKYEGWGPTSKLTIEGSGLVSAYLIQHASTEVLDSATAFLSDDDKRQISNLFRSFSSYNGHYEPKEYRTDQDTHVIVLDYEGVLDTVTVYMPDEATLPLSLRKIIQEMETLWENMIAVPQIE